MVNGNWHISQVDCSKIFYKTAPANIPSQDSIQIISNQTATTNMSASQDQTPLNAARGAGTTFGPDSTSDPSSATPSMSVGSATAAGHGQHPNDKNADVSNVSMPNSKVGPQQEDLDGEQMRPPGEGEVMDSQLNKNNAGWGEQPSLTSDLDRQKAKQKDARDEVKQRRSAGGNVDSGAGNRTESEGIGSV
jgi:hypothetical protein